LTRHRRHFSQARNPKSASRLNTRLCK
jgi:hypothetical protein